MKIYIHINEDHRNVAYPWQQYIEEQVKETIKLVNEEYSFDYATTDDSSLFPSFTQEDTHSRYVVKNGERYNLDFGPAYTLMFVWQPEDFLPYTESDEENVTSKIMSMYNEACVQNGVMENHEEPIPEGFVYLGSYVYLQKDPINLPGLILDEEDQLCISVKLIR